jgi:ABC-type polysaccharide/polyol phosphate transport system ATPase subunit
MSETALEFHDVFKKFRRGERHDSLRDLFPALARRTARRLARAVALEAEEFWALQEISFSVRRGEAVGIIGHNGAGKSTMLKLLSGILQPTRGSIHVEGRLSSLIEVGAGFHQDLTGRENVYMNGVILGMSRAEVRRKFDEIVEFSGLAEFIDTPVKRYSSGMYARLGFAVAAHLEPDVLIVDEVLSVGDFNFQAKSIAKMRAVQRSGATVVFVSHNLQAMSDLCDRALLLEKGRLLQDGPTSRVINAYMERTRMQRTQLDDRPVYIERITVRSGGSPRFDFRSGDVAQVEVVVRANRDTRRVACVLHLMDANYYEVFEVSSERLQGSPRDYAAGEEIVYCFELEMNLSSGNYQLGAVLYRHDSGTLFDRVDAAATLLIVNPVLVRGVADLRPRLVQSEANGAPGSL